MLFEQYRRTTIDRYLLGNAIISQLHRSIPIAQFNMFTVIPIDTYCPVQYVHIDIDRHLLPNLICLPGCQWIPIARYNSCSTVSIDTYRPMQDMFGRVSINDYCPTVNCFERGTINVYCPNGSSFIGVRLVLTCLWLRYSMYTPSLPPPIYIPCMACR